MFTTTDGRRVLPFEPQIRSAIVESPAAQPAAPPVSPATRGWVNTLLVVGVWAAVVVGVGVRVNGYLQNPSFWIDEAMLALNVVHRTPAELLQPLDLNQGAPVGFLLASKLSVKWFGPSEYSLRLIPFVTGLIGFAAFVPLAYRALPLGAGRLAVVLFALAPYLAGYCAEFKQYESDAMLATVMMLIALPIWQGTAGRGRLVAFALVGAIAVWFSHPIAFVLGGVGSAVLLDAAVRRDRAALLARLLAVGCWVVSFGTCYLLFTRKLGMNQFLIDYWMEKFMPMPPTRPGDFAWLVMHYFEFFQKPGGLNADTWGLAGVAGLCYLVGAIALAKADWRMLVALVVPMGLCLFASGLQKYPFAGRLMLFAVPAMLVLTAYGAWVIIDRLRPGLPGAGAALVGILVGSGMMESYWLVTQRPMHGEQTREGLAQIWNDWQNGDKLYVFYGAAPAFGYYHPRFPFPADSVVVGEYNRKGPQSIFHEELKPFRGNRRVWAIVAHRQTYEETAIRAYLDGMGKCEEYVRRPDAIVMRYDLSRTD
jgi:hypothetical protein